MQNNALKIGYQILKHQKRSGRSPDPAALPKSAKHDMFMPATAAQNIFVT